MLSFSSGYFGTDLINDRRQPTDDRKNTRVFVGRRSPVFGRFTGWLVGDGMSE
jgi:hypothetical protein